jgi:hypothetical protein
VLPRRTVLRRCLTLAFVAALAVAGAIVTPAPASGPAGVGAPGVEHAGPPPRTVRPEWRFTAALIPFVFTPEPPQVGPHSDGRCAPAPVVPLLASSRSSRGPPPAIV